MIILPENKTKQAVPSVGEDELERQRLAFQAALQFAKKARYPIWSVDDASTKASVTYSRYTKEDILGYMKNPASNEKYIRKASIYMFDASSQYRRLIQYYGMLLTWDYVLVPVGFDASKQKKPDGLRKQYQRVGAEVDRMNLKHELQRATIIALRDGVFYGAVWQSKDNFYVQRIDPDICSLTTISNGTWLYSVDMSQIQEKKLSLYPPEFTTMYNAYRNGGNKYQEVPEKISFCLKADESNVAYSIPPWASTLPLLYDIETYKALQVTASKIANYKLLAMEIPLNSDGTPQIDWGLADRYYDQLTSVLPPYVGATIAPMKITDHSFEKSGGVESVDNVSRAEEQFWFTTGTSSLLHGSSVSDTAGTLKFSIRSDEELMFGFMKQAERLVNRFVEQISGTIRFKIKFLPVTVFNQAEMISLYKEAATLGVPGSKSAYAAALGVVEQPSVPGMDYLEQNVLGMNDWEPIKSGYTSPADDDDGGRPQKPLEDLDAEGEKTRDSGANANR